MISRHGGERRAWLSFVLTLSGCLLSCQQKQSPAPRSEAQTCGNAVVDESEACDDGNGLDGDGCSGTCGLELGWECSKTEPTSCRPVCGDGLRRGAEACDDGANNGEGGCTSECFVRRGWSCDEGSPSACGPLCGDSVMLANEQCDDGNQEDGDGCDRACHIELGFRCGSSPDSCAPVCGDGLMRGSETCDDGNLRGGDSCNALCVRVDRWRSLAASAAAVLPYRGGFLLDVGGEIFMFASGSWIPRAFNPTRSTWRFVDAMTSYSGFSSNSIAWTGQEIFVYMRDGSGSNPGVARLFNPRTERWRETTREGLPDINPVATVWTGSEILVWGESVETWALEGARYDPVRDSWSPMRAFDFPLSPDHEPQIAWTGEQLLVVTAQAVNAIYDPSLDEWEALSSFYFWGDRAPLVAKAGDEIFVLRFNMPEAKAYDPRTHSWRDIAIPDRLWGESGAEFNPVWLNWTGEELVFVSAQLNGWRYVPVLHEWIPFDGLPPDDPVSPVLVTTAVVGGEIFVHGGQWDDSSNLASITPEPVWLRLDPTTHAWETSVVENPAPRPTFGSSAVLADSNLLFFGGVDVTEPISGSGPARLGPSLSSWMYSPRTGEWTRLSQEGQAEGRMNALLVWSGRELIVWGGAGDLSAPESGGIYNPGRSKWRSMSPGNRVPHLDSIAVWSGREMFVWSPPGAERNEPPFAAYDPEMDTWRPILSPDGPTSGLSDGVRLGDEILFYGESGVSRFDFVAGSWRHVSLENNPLANTSPSHPPIGVLGNDQFFMLVGADLAQYDAARDAWRRVEVPPEHRPALEEARQALFTGSTLVFLPRGANAEPVPETLRPLVAVLYDPVDGRWWTTPTLNAPVIGSSRTYTWTGSELIVFGGGFPGGILPL